MALSPVTKKERHLIIRTEGKFIFKNNKLNKTQVMKKNEKINELLFMAILYTVAFEFGSITLF